MKPSASVEVEVKVEVQRRELHWFGIWLGPLFLGFVFAKSFPIDAP